MKFLDSLRPVGLLALRIALGVIFLYHGYPKLAHSGGGQEFYIQHGLPGYFLHISGLLELFGGALLAMGLFTRPAALLLAIELGVVLWKTHGGGNYLAVASYEFPLAITTACFALATTGAGIASVDHLLFGEGGKASRTAKASKK